MQVVNPIKAYSFFKAHYGIKKPSPKKWYSFDCPLCSGKKKRAVNFRYQITKCWTCDLYTGHLIGFVQAVQDIPYQYAKDLLNEFDGELLEFDTIEHIVTDSVVSDVVLPTGFNSLLSGDNIIAKRARNTLRNRGFDLERLDMMGYGYCDKHDEDKNKDFYGYIVIPFKKDGRLVYYIGRDFLGNYLRYKNPDSTLVGVGKSEVIYNEEALYLYDEIGIMEGALDAETFGNNGTATLGWSMSGHQKSKYLKSSCKSLVFIPDAGTDNQGERFYIKAVRAAMDFLDSGKRIRVVDLDMLVSLYQHQNPGTPENQLPKDVNAFGKAAIMWQLKRTPDLTWSEAIDKVTL